MNRIDYLSLHDLLLIAAEIIPGFQIRDFGLLESAAYRPQTTVNGEDAYQTLVEKAAALLHSLARNHSLVDGNKRLAWSATRTFLILNDADLSLEIDEAEDLVVATAAGKLDVYQIAARLAAGVKD